MQLALFLPLATLRGCGQARPRTITGFGFYGSSNALGFTIALVAVIALLVAFPWKGGRTPRDAAALGLRAFVAGVGALVALGGPLFQLIESVTPRVGWFLHGGSWLALYLGYLGLAAHVARGLPKPPHDPPVAEGWGVAALVLSPLCSIPFGAFVEWRRGDPVPAVGLVGLFVLAYAFVGPLGLAGLGLVRARQANDPPPVLRALWWLATGLVLALQLAAALAR